MKKFFVLVLFFVLSFSASRAQINLQYTFPALINNFYLSIVRFGYAGDKYLKYDPANDKIEIYSLTQVLEIDITIPTSIVGASSYNTFYVSDNLFDSDSSIEYLVITNAFPQTLYILNEDSVVLFSRDSVGSFSPTNPNYISGFSNIYPSVDGTKLILSRINTGMEVYSLPGNLPCHECSDGSYTGNASVFNTNQNPGGLSNPFPNPTSNLTRINYQLPNGIQQGELVFYNTAGTEVKRFKVTSTFSFINVSAHDLPSGTYYYNLETSAGTSEGKKMVVIR